MVCAVYTAGLNLYHRGARNVGCFTRVHRGRWSRGNASAPANTHGGWFPSCILFFVTRLRFWLSPVVVSCPLYEKIVCSFQSRANKKKSWMARKGNVARSFLKVAVFFSGKFERYAGVNGCLF